MPIFEYCCLNCGETFEKLVLNGRQQASMECPECNSSEIERVYSVFNGKTARQRVSNCSFSSST